MININNFRDINSSNIKLKQNMIYRSGNPDFIKSNKMIESGIKSIIDLRTFRERKRSKIFNGVTTKNFPINYDFRIKERVQKIIFKKNAYREILEIIKEEYINFPEFEKNTVKSVFNILSEEKNYPVLIHCRAGKDRTGFIISIILKSLGTDDESIIKDYLVSNDLFFNKAKKIIRLFKLLTVGLFNTKNIECLLTSHSENIQAVLREIEKKYANINNYLQSCGVDNSVINKIKKIIFK